MPVSGNSRRSPSSKRARRRRLWPETLAAVLMLAALASAVLSWVQAKGWVILYGDAEAHLNIARRIVDSRTPGYDQTGTVWLPLPHWLMLPLVRHDALWRNGLAGALPAAAGFVAAGAFFYAACRVVFGARPLALAALALLALNPNLLYMQSTAMTEPVWLATLTALLYFTERFRARPSARFAAAAGAASLAGSLTRYEGWFLIPFVTAYLLLVGGRRRWLFGLLYAALASLGPLYWLAHNWWLHGNPLEFYNGPYSARAIYQRSLDAGMARYPGDHDWLTAGVQLREAVRLCAGTPLVWLALLGGAAAAWRRRLWPLVLLALVPLFYWLSIYSAGTPIFVPHRWPFSYYNTRYGLSALPLLAFAAASLAWLAPERIRAWAAAGVVALAVAPWVVRPSPEAWICWKEAQVNSESRRTWTREAAEYLATHRRSHEGIVACFGDLTGVFRAAGIPLRHLLHEGNGPAWDAMLARPDLFLREPWALVISGDTVAGALLRCGRGGPRYDLEKVIAGKGGPVVQIYRRRGPARREAAWGPGRSQP